MIVRKFLLIGSVLLLLLAYCHVLGQNRKDHALSRLQLPYPIEFDLRPIGEPLQTGNAMLEFIITPNWKFDSLAVEISTEGGLVYQGEKYISFQADTGHTHRIAMNVIIPENDTSAIHLEIYANGRNINVCRRYFVPLGDKVIIYRGRPKARPPKM